MSEGVSNVTTVKVDSNMIDKYLEGLRSSWVPANEVLKEQGRIKDYGIYVSELPNGGDFNVILVVRFDAESEQALERIKAEFRRQMLGLRPDLNLPF